MVGSHRYGLDEVEAAHCMIDGTSITVVGWHGYGRARGRVITYFTKRALQWFASTVIGEVGPITYFTKPALLQLASTVMSEVGAHNTFHGAGITVVGGTVMGKGGSRNIFQGASIMIDWWHGYGRGRDP